MEIKKLKVYICLPIKGKDLEAQKKEAEKMANLLEDKGMEAVNPFKNGLTAKDPREKHMEADIKMLLECDAILPLRGWQFSVGCQLEMNIAAQTGKIILFTPEEESLRARLTSKEYPF